MGNVEAYILISDAPGIRSPVDDEAAARNQALRREDFPRKIAQITSAMPSIDIVEQHDQVGSVSMTMELGRFQLFHTFMLEHPELGTIASFHVQHIPDEPLLHTMLSENKPGFTASPQVPLSPSSSV
ncbi:hypothetical protein A2454_04190 [Candidatus Peribacteria bacterium RIFOXYC2_FULL_55_14]|nr:MAG: hypothetical protein UY90_C0026G0013 [Candidatus Peregrinibacteria bacterium GW2011_GWA2_54_9]OGJ70916.1 MAG: hypothetical protein A2198_00715 [Candidatus Peribacteria bacterium RIFOXYA1_FULL_56_14]OGJ74211.1 MAG: hypothetical protein A2384_05750 [Candidatus Peribacteria bacterium RIFOXYB1_FULL_54_35]OGJ75255.1 MAG: hypothetical protein A2217_06050 [Candidatus Peribacteria bacterium RIFOXYA2_FULL_55_28]OGJ75828.1 MAG: hypothetical protein A2327_02895 [Candidatus Peribacteria bacterium R